MTTDDDTSGSSYMYGDAVEFPAAEYRGKLVVKRLKLFDINVSGINGNVAVGPHARINGGQTNQQNEDSVLRDGNSSTSDSNTGYNYYARNSEEHYCHHNYYQQTNVGDWIPKPINGILIQKGEIDFQWSVESFLENPEKFIREMDTCAGSLKEEKEQFILRGILPYLEREMWGKSAANNIDVYRVLAHVSFSRSSGDVAKHSLQQLEHLLYRDCIQSSKQNLLSVEKILRLTIVSPDGAFREEADSLRLLRLTVYGCILSELIIHQIQAGFSQIDLKNNLKQLREIKNYFSQISLKKKDTLRYSIDFVQEAISYLTRSPNKTMTTRLGRYLKECKAFCNGQIVDKELSLIQNLKNSKVKWFELHCILYYLHGKVHTERPTEQIHQERRTMNLFTRVVIAYLDGGGGDDWRFCLLAASILSEIAMNNATKALRIQASSCLVYLRKNEKAWKRPECRVIIDRFSKGLLFCHDSLIKKLFVPHFYDNQNEQYMLPAELHIQHLVSCYKTQTLEINNMITIEPSCENPSCFVNHGMLKRQEVAVKVLGVTKKDLLEEESLLQSEAKKRLRAEAYNLWQLNNLRRHPNIPGLLAYNTATFPFHIITEYERYGNLLQFVRGSRESKPLQSAILYKMLIGITEGLLYLQEELHLVHRAVMAENILVGDGHIPKLSGMHSLAVLQYGPNRDVQDNRSSGYDYALVDDGLPEFKSENDENLPVRWKAPESLSGNQYSIASDVWAFAVLVYEVLTLGCRPYRDIQKDDQVVEYVLHKNDDEVLPHESCIEDDEYELMKQCWKRKRGERIGLFELKVQLLKMRLKIAKSGEEKPQLNPPRLELNIGNELQQSQGSLLESVLYEDIPGEEKLRLNPPRLELNIANELQQSQGSRLESVFYEDIPEYSDVESRSQTIYEDYYEDPSRAQRDETSTTLVDLPTNYHASEDLMKERITRGDKQHLRRLLSLRNNYLLPISRIDHLDTRSPVVDIISPKAPLGNLKEYVLSRRCQKEDINTFLCQVASALHYLHVHHIVHGDLRAEYVYVIEPNKVQVGRLGRSKSLTMSAYEVTSTSCVVEAVLPPDSTRWCAPEVIQENHYSHASDVWAFGILMWELYSAFAAGQDDRITSLPYYNITVDKILAHMKEKGPLDQPSGCPDWVYILMHQCWTYQPTQRPPFIAIIDCLSRREPMLSWIMTLWLNKHEKSNWPVLPIYQPEDACHVTKTEKHPSKEDIEKMCSQGFFTSHKYWYVESVHRSTIEPVGEDLYESLPTGEDVPDPTGTSAVLLHETNDDTYQIMNTEEHTADFVESNDSISSHQAVDEIESGSVHRRTIETVGEDLYGSLPPDEDIPGPTGSSAVLLHETNDDTYQVMSTQEHMADFDESNDNHSISSHQAVDEIHSGEGDCSMSQPEDPSSVTLENNLQNQTKYYRDDKEYNDIVAFSSSYYGDFCHAINTDQHPSDEASNKVQDNLARFDIAKDDSKGDLILQEKAGYKELALSSEGYMPLRNDQEIAKPPSYINLQTEELGAKLLQTECSSKGTLEAHCYMCVDLLGLSPRQGTKYHAANSESTSCNEHDNNMEHQLKDDPDEDMAIQLMLNSAENFYRNEVQKRKNWEKEKSQLENREGLYQNWSSLPQQELWNEHLKTYVNVLTNTGVSFESTLYVSSMETRWSRLVDCDRETTI